MFCPKCGTQLTENAIFCTNCGTKVVEASPVPDNTAKPSQPSPDVAPNTQTPPQSARPSGNRNENIERYMHSMFVQDDEYAKAVIGSGYLSNLVHSGTLTWGFGVLTNRRLYYRGACYKKEQGHYKKVNEERVVALQDITSSGFISVNNFTVFLLAILVTIWAAIWTLVAVIEVLIVDPFSLMVSILFAYLPCGLLWVLYIFNKMKMYEVTFAGGNIAIKASSYNETEVREFDKALRFARDEYLAKNR